MGLFTSPHLQTVRERIVIQGIPIAPDMFAKAYDEVCKLSERLIEADILDTPPTFFESVFLTALFCFHWSGVSIIVWEVGLGGRLDATSTLHPVLHIITNISLEHTRILGHTLQKIADEKAGMIKTGVPVICGCPPRSAAYRQIRKRALELTSPFLPLHHGPDVLREHTGQIPLTGAYRLPSGHWVALEPRMPGAHQLANAATAVLAMTSLAERGIIPPVAHDAMLEAMRSVQVPGRVEHLSLKNTPPVVLDGGHNLDGIAALVRALKQQNIGPATVIFGVLGDKSYRRMVQMLLPACARVILIRPDSHRALNPEKLLPLFAPHVPTTLARTPEEAWALARNGNHPILITGSLYLAGTFRNLLRGEAV